MEFKGGLEIHQQLNTKEKLFCKCKNIISDKYSKEIIRKLRIAKSEIGDIDIAAKYETEKDKIFVYQYDDEYSCLIELDERPPELINEEALKFAILFAEFFNMYIPNVLQVMRKIVVDGSNTTGFQRTLLIGINGNININGKIYGIETLCLEEDAARKIDEDDEKIIYRLDRLGIPLIEISTSPDAKNPRELREIAEYIGLVLRLSGFVKRGLGTIRQDVNISVNNMNKIEIKGVQDLKLIEKVAEYEIKRQLNLLKWQEEAKKRGIDKYEVSI